MEKNQKISQKELDEEISTLSQWVVLNILRENQDVGLDIDSFDPSELLDLLDKMLMSFRELFPCLFAIHYYEKDNYIKGGCFCKVEKIISNSMEKKVIFSDKLKKPIVVGGSNFKNKTFINRLLYLIKGDKNKGSNKDILFLINLKGEMILFEINYTETENEISIFEINTYPYKLFHSENLLDEDELFLKHARTIARFIFDDIFLFMTPETIDRVEQILKEIRKVEILRNLLK